MTPKVTYVPTVIQWVENGKIEQRTMKIEEGFEFNFEQSDKYKYKPKAYDTSKGKIPVLSLSKEDAYNLLGLSHAHEDGYKSKSGQQIYVLNSQDLEVAKEADKSNIKDNLTKKQIIWAGSGARVTKAESTTNGGLNLFHNATNSEGKREEYKISVFFNNKK